jgi:cyclophilin family peptidyl-prolyl cis-trans isomerase
VAAEQEKDGKSSGRRFFITANDCAGQYDGDYVIFGRVIRGGQHIQDIVSGDMLDETEENAGEGRPVEDIQVVSSELKKK